MSTEGFRLLAKKCREDYDELHFLKIDQKLIKEIPLEHKYQIQYVLTVIKEAIEKFKISLILPQIFENPKILHKYLKNTKYENCFKLVKEYKDQRKHETLEVPPKTNPNLIKIIDYFHENYKILDILPQWLDDIDNTENLLLKSFEDLYQVANVRLHRSAMADLTKEEPLHKVYLANENVKKEIEDLTQKFQNKDFISLWKSAAKTGVIQNLEDELASNQYNKDTFVQQQIAKSSQEILKINKAGIAKQLELEEELDKARSNYEKTLNEDLIQEKNVRDEKNKLQLQLQALIKKYDQTIYDKTKEEIFLEEEYQCQKREFEEFMLEYQREEAIYDEYQCLRQEKISLFRNNCAAKKIQRWWKKYLRKQKRIKKKMAKLAKRSKGKKEIKAATYKGVSKDEKGI